MAQALKNTGMKTYIYSVLFCSMMWLGLHGQSTKKDDVPENKPNYRNAIGLRAGGTSGITYKHFFSEYTAFEGIFGIWQNAFGVTGLYEKHAPTGLTGLKFYYGVGGHFTRETGVYLYRRVGGIDRTYQYRYGNEGLAVGIDGIVGIDWKIPVIPLALSFDLKPFIEISNYGTLYPAIDPALGIKVAF
jgi:hypothetical protein